MEHILLHEIAPVFVWKLLSVAGEWTSWPDSFVKGKMRAAVSHRRTASWPVARLPKRLLQKDLERLRAFLPTQGS